MNDALKTDTTRTTFGLLCYNCNCSESHRRTCPHKTEDRYKDSIGEKNGINFSKPI